MGLVNGLDRCTRCDRPQPRALPLQEEGPRHDQTTPTKVVHDTANTPLTHASVVDDLPQGRTRVFPDVLEHLDGVRQSGHAQPHAVL